VSRGHAAFTTLRIGDVEVASKQINQSECVRNKHTRLGGIAMQFVVTKKKDKAAFPLASLVASFRSLLPSATDEYRPDMYTEICIEWKRYPYYFVEFIHVQE
jgi:hypothetical protein